MTVNSIPDERVLPKGYNPSHHIWQRRLCRFLLGTIGVPWLTKIDKVEGLENVPPTGPAIVMINHIAFVDSIVVLFTLPRNVVPMAKVEVYDYPVIGLFPRLWGVIPVRREEMDRRAIKMALDVLQAGEMILLAPEATRGPCLQQGKEGVAYLASRTGVPVVPVAIESTVGFPTYPFSRRWRGPGAHVRFGKPFRFRSDFQHPNRVQLRQMTDEAMYILAAMLPENRRGVYADLTQATQETIEYSDANNL
jgi:1-acyl-sn-glycerol-3-phosphate acyltransferase